MEPLERLGHVVATLRVAMASRSRDRTCDRPGAEISDLPDKTRESGKSVVNMSGATRTSIGALVL